MVGVRSAARRATAAALGCVALLLAAPAMAGAVTRYAVADGAGVGACASVADGCSFAAAVGASEPGEKVVVGAGTHNLPNRVTTFSGRTIEGEPGTRPVVQGPDPGAGYGLINVEGSDTTVSHLDIRFTGPSDRPLVTMQSGTGGLLRDLVVTNSGTSSAIGLYQGTMDTVVVRTTGPAFSDVWACSSTIRNATLTGGAPYAVAAHGSFCGPIDLNVTNTIALGTTGGIQLVASTGAPDRPVTLNIDHSNFASIVKGGGVPDSLYTVTETANQSAAPQLVNLTLGDIHQLPGSPTIDAGTAGGVGPADIDGQARSSGAAPDIGADEEQVPPAEIPNAPSFTLARDVTAPVISGARLSHRRFRAGPGLSASARRPAPRGTAFLYRLSERADVTVRLGRRSAGLRIQKRLGGRRSCVRASRANRRALRRQLSRRRSIRLLTGRARARALKRAARRRGCSRYTSVGTLRYAAVGPGPVRTEFPGRLAGKALRPASYRAEVRASDAAGNTSDPKRLAFTVLRSSGA